MRLPGKHSITQGKLDVDTPTQALDKLVQILDRVRVGNCIYTVPQDGTAVTDKVVPIDRAWRFDDKTDFVFYRFPAQNKWVAKGRKVVYDIVESQVLQMGLRLLLKGGDFFEIFLTFLNRFAKSKLSLASAKKVKKFADGFSKRKRRFM